LWDDALEISVEVLEVEARRRALDRADHHSAALLQFLLKAHKPAKYRDNYKAPASDLPLAATEDLSGLSDDELIRRTKSITGGTDPSG
jgi:hypothetical protein